MTVSRWERGLLAPSAEYYIRLGILTDGSDTWFFWGQAGLQTADVARKLNPVSGESTRPSTMSQEIAAVSQSPNEQASVRIPLLKAVVGAHGSPGTKRLSLDSSFAIKRTVTTPAEWCPNPPYTSLVRVKGGSMLPLIQNGTVLAVDSFQTDPELLDGKIVVVTSEHSGLCVSRLRRYQTLTVLESESRKSPSIVLDRDSGLRILGRVLWWIAAAP